MKDGHPTAGKAAPPAPPDVEPFMEPVVEGRPSAGMAAAGADQQASAVAGSATAEPHEGTAGAAGAATGKSGLCPVEVPNPALAAGQPTGGASLSAESADWQADVDAGAAVEEQRAGLPTPPVAATYLDTEGPAEPAVDEPAAGATASSVGEAAQAQPQVADMSPCTCCPNKHSNLPTRTFSRTT